MRYVVGYTPNRRGEDAINLAVALARARRARVDIVVVLPERKITYDMYSPDRAYHAHLKQQGCEWLERALEAVPDGMDVNGRVRHAQSIVEGLIEDATDPDVGEEAALIAIGASHRGLTGYFTVGSIASGLLHSSPVPVALAPSGYGNQEAITRITCATGTRQGAGALLDAAIEGAKARKIPLRLMSLVALGSGHLDSDHNRAVMESARRHAQSLVQKASRTLPGRSDISCVVGQGESTEEAVRSLDFAPTEIVLVGSSRLASPKRLFLGRSANKMLRALPVPMVVVPRDYRGAP